MAKIKQTTRKNAVNIWYIQIKSIPLQSISERQIVVLNVVGSNPTSHPSTNKTFLSNSERNVFYIPSAAPSFVTLAQQNIL